MQVTQIPTWTTPVRRARLEKLVRIASGRKYIKVFLDHSRSGGYRIANSIFIGTKYIPNKVYPDMSDDLWMLIVQRAIAMHELGHIYWTDWNYGTIIYKELKETYGSLVAEFFWEIRNIIEDARVDRGIAREFLGAGFYIKKLRENYGKIFYEDVVYNKKYTESQLQDPVFQYTTFLHNYLIYDDGIFRWLIEQGYLNPVTERLILETSELVSKAMVESDCKKVQEIYRDTALKVYDILREEGLVQDVVLVIGLSKNMGCYHDNSNQGAASRRYNAKKEQEDIDISKKYYNILSIITIKSEQSEKEEETEGEQVEPGESEDIDNDSDFSIIFGEPSEDDNIKLPEDEESSGEEDKYDDEHGEDYEDEGSDHTLMGSAEILYEEEEEEEEINTKDQEELEPEPEPETKTKGKTPEYDKREKEILKNLEKELAQELHEIKEGSGSGETDAYEGNAKMVQPNYNAWKQFSEERIRSVGNVIAMGLLTMLRERTKGKYKPGYKNGRLHTKSLWKLQRNDYRIFKKKEKEKELNYTCFILLDRSGSMFGSRIKKAEYATLVLCYALEKVGVPTEVIGYNSWGIYIHKTLEEKFEYAKYKITQLEADGGTPTGHALAVVKNRIRSIPDKDKKNPFIIIVTDGHPTDGNRSVQEIKTCPYPVIGVTIGISGTTEWEKIYHAEVGVNSVDDLLPALTQLVKKLMF